MRTGERRAGSARALLIVLLTLASTTACATRAAVSSRAAHANRALVLRFHDALNRQDWTLLDSLVTPDYRHYVVADSGFRALTWADVRRGNAAVRAAFPDWVNTPMHVLTDDSGHVSVLLVGRGTHRASLAGEAPSGLAAVLPIAVVHEVRDGRISADWEVSDTGPLMRRITTPTAPGAAATMPAPPPTTPP